MARMRFLGVLLGVVGTTTGALAQFEPLLPPQEYSFEAGTPRRWEAGIQATPYAIVNLQNLNVITAIPIVSWSGRGPAITVWLFHNSAAATSGLTAPAGTGFSMGPGWRISYGGQVIPMGSTAAVVVEDDGTSNTFIKVGNDWLARPGVFDRLTKDTQTGEWTLTRTDQSYRRFDNKGRLIAVGDGLGNEVFLHYGTIQIGQEVHKTELQSVTDAAGRTFDFDLNSNGQLVAINAPLPESGTRTWTLAYDALGRLHSVNDPRLTQIAWQYMDELEEPPESPKDSRIGRFTDRNDRVYTWEDIGQDCASEDDITNGFRVVDPPPTNQSLTVRSQCFVLYAPPPGGADYRDVGYTDRFGSRWRYRFAADSSEIAGTLIHRIDPAGKTRRYTYNFDYLPGAFTDELGSGHEDPNHTWHYTWDAAGNLLSVTNPLGQKTAFTYDEWNNLTSVTPAADSSGGLNQAKGVTFRYDQIHENHARPLLVSTTQPADGVENSPSNSPAETILAWYGPGAAGGTWNGLLKNVTDPLSVTHDFTYDEWGQPATAVEAQATSEAIRQWVSYDIAGRPRCGGVGLPSDCLGLVTGEPRGCTAQLAPQWNAQYDDCCDCPRRTQCPDSVPCSPSGNLALTSTWCAPPINNYIPMRSGCFQVNYDGEYQPTLVTSCLYDYYERGEGGRERYRNWTIAYNELNIPTTQAVSTTEPKASGGWFSRTFGGVLNFAEGTYDLTGPDGHVTRVQLDARGLPASVERRSGETVLMSATVDQYEADGLVRQVSYGNGARTLYEYDNARRLTKITHQRICSGSPATTLLLEYAWTPDGLIASISETDYGPTCVGPPAVTVVAFTYDNRNRLVRERRAVQTQPETVTYDFSYRYDQNGNRVLKRADEANYVAYAYDVDENPLSTASRANRLLEYTVVADSQEVARVHYEYDGFGHVGRVVRHDLLTDEFFATNLYYTTGGRLWLALDQTWDVNTNGPENCQTTRCREFRYDSGRARYLVRERDPSPGPGFLEPRNDAVWTDYVGDGPYAERFIDRDTGQAQDRASFVPGIAQRDESAQPPAEQPLYFHGDQIGTSRVLTDGDGNVAARIVYTAFGEPVFSEPPAQAGGLTRYLYAGAWGYENFNDPGFPFLHVGERWYDPATGRFLQRDPIGLAGGLNVYAYLDANPLADVDIEGMSKWGERLKRAEKQVFDWGKRACSVVRKVSLDMMGGQKAPVGVSVVAPVAAGLEAAPDIVRVYCGVKHRRNAIEGGVTAGEAMDLYEKGHGKYVIPPR